MRLERDGQRGQALIEMAFVLTALILCTSGLIDVGRAFYQYNALSNAARFGARWASVVGGNCNTPGAPNVSTSDWCNEFASGSPAHSTTAFWNISGNHPRQTDGSECPSHYDSSNASYWYTPSSPTATNSTVVGAVMQHLDSNSTTSNFAKGLVMPGFIRSKVHVCIYLPSTDYVNGIWSPVAGDTVAVYLSYDFQPAGPLFGSVTLPLVASSRYIVECCASS